MQEDGAVVNSSNTNYKPDLSLKVVTYKLHTWEPLVFYYLVMENLEWLK